MSDRFVDLSKAIYDSKNDFVEVDGYIRELGLEEEDFSKSEDSNVSSIGTIVDGGGSGAGDTYSRTRGISEIIHKKVKVADKEVGRVEDNNNAVSGTD
jgi:hypothetical protein